ncbi:primosomal protein N' [Hoylesella buccalis]|uniref:replication restart helicase PriA n=1 Tax=Hoylesella buccalis TaxID=28127 RepID=UPI001D07A40D|nr:primosomal protein N' [Hoylesella buccalis]MCB6901028.1 primosomal protein N' [Hoylesella buccalis]UEA64224.1 primosomal protein N' [Hoylesella buccalis]UWP49083.1 primosomal protein N' [Hoylesella buccalis ATCC 35310]
MKYVDVIVPLPLEGTFTYSVPHNLAERVRFGVRVAVTFGASKVHTAIVVRVHQDKPAFNVKDIVDVIDDQPMLLEQQYQLWQWLSGYYMAPLGDVYNAALPAGLKVEENYKPRTETYIDLCEPLRNEQSLNVALDLLKRARNQREALMHFLRISHWETIEGTQTAEPVVDITREELMNVSRCSYAVIKSLVERKILFTYEREVGRLNDHGEEHLENVKRLNEAQQEAYNQIVFQFLKKNVVLLHGVTSSGKTEIYIHLIKKALEEKKQVLYLLPEIALTVQITSRLRHVFGNKLGIYHSKYSDAERVEIWKKQLSHHPYEVILGARSAVFLPFQRLGLVIIDEEHETSFKQQDPSPRYHARSAAIVLARMYGAKTLLGTATPSVESYYNACQGKYGLVTLTSRYKDIQLPEIRVVDTKDLQRRKMMTGPFSPPLIAAVNEALKNGQQVILFQNRRGFAPMIECRTCGWVPKCTNCDVSLTMHKSMNLLTCHYCGYTYRIPTVCPACGGTDLRGRGFGTEKVEEYVGQLFPEARVARMDLDTTRTRNAYGRIIDDFSSGRTNLLIGTQMVSKGLDFDRVSVVGILNADAMLNYPDFRAYEHAFMMMAQVSGRAGRKGQRGKVFLQTKNKDLAIIRQVVGNDYQGFYEALLEERRMFSYPPFYRLVYVFLRHRHDDVVETAGIEMGSRLRQGLGDRILGPDKPSIARVKNLHIRKIVIKLENGIDQKAVRLYLRTVQQQLLQDKRYAALQVYYDVDPL